MHNASIETAVVSFLVSTLRLAKYRGRRALALGLDGTFEVAVGGPLWQWRAIFVPVVGPLRVTDAAVLAYLRKVERRNTASKQVIVEIENMEV